MPSTIKLSKAPNDPDPWVRAKSKKKLGYNIGSLLGTRSVKGDIGIEIEVEGNKFPKHEYEGYNARDPHYIPDVWVYHKDGSLRGEDNAEYVFRKPMEFDEVPKAINDLWEMFSKYGSVLDDSNRTSVHVHLNAQKWHLNRLCSFAAIWFSLEELLTEWCGDHRVGNMFCLRAKDAPAIITKLKNFLREEGRVELTDGLHYAGLNVQALMKFGSVEVRALRGCRDPQTLLQWVGILRRIYEVSAEYPDPRGVIEGFSGEGPMGYLDRILGSANAQILRSGISFDNQRVMASIHEGIRLAQDLAYCREWQDYEPVQAEPDPFGRKIDTSQLVAHAEALAASSTMDNQIWASLNASMAGIQTAPASLYTTGVGASMASDPVYHPPSDSEEVDNSDEWDMPSFDDYDMDDNI